MSRRTSFKAEPIANPDDQPTIVVFGDDMPIEESEFKYVVKTMVATDMTTCTVSAGDPEAFELLTSALTYATRAPFTLRSEDGDEYEISYDADAAEFTVYSAGFQEELDSYEDEDEDDDSDEYED